MIETFYGPKFLGIGILIDQLGSYFVLFNLGIPVALLHWSSQEFNPKSVIRKSSCSCRFRHSCWHCC